MLDYKDPAVVKRFTEALAGLDGDPERQKLLAVFLLAAAEDGGDLEAVVRDARRALEVAEGGEWQPMANAFCPTGEGGGIDPTCSPGSGGRRLKKGVKRAEKTDNPLPRVSPALEEKIEQALAKFAKPDTIREFVRYSQTEEQVPISGLSSPQTVKDVKAVEHFKKNQDAIDDTEPLPLVIQYGRTMLLRDGNSRATAAMELGRTHLKARVVFVPEGGE